MKNVRNVPRIANFGWRVRESHEGLTAVYETRHVRIRNASYPDRCGAHGDSGKCHALVEAVFVSSLMGDWFILWVILAVSLASLYFQAREKK
jgi:hypothetical protein